MMMSHLQEGIHLADVPTQVKKEPVYNNLTCKLAAGFEAVGHVVN